MTNQDLLTHICWKYEEAARTILRRYAQDPGAAAECLVSFLVRLNEDIDVTSCYFRSREGVVSGLQSPGTSVCRVAFLRFCELLYEAPPLISAVQAASEYQRGVGDSDFFKHRGSNVIALTRGTSWEAEGFADPNPLSRDVIERFQEEQLHQQRLDVLRREREARMIQEFKEARKRAIAPIIEQRRQASQVRAALRSSFCDKSRAHQLRDLALISDYPITVFPFDPLSIEDDDLKSLDREVLKVLAQRLTARREKRWKALLARVERVLNPDAQEQR